MEAEYGEEVRSSIYDAIKAGNDEIVVYGRKEEERSQAEAGRIAAENTRAAAEVLREAAKAAAEAAAEAANEAAEKANEAATGGISKMIVNFEEPEGIELPESGETVDTLFGKMKKWLGNLSSGAGSSLLGHLFSPGRVLASNENGRVTESNVSVADLANLSGMTGNLQEQITQLNGKLQIEAVPVTSNSNGGVILTCRRQGNKIFLNLYGVNQEYYNDVLVGWTNLAPSFLMQIASSLLTGVAGL